LAKKKVVRLTEESFNSVREDEELISILISNGIAEYLKKKEDYPINDTVREKLLCSDIRDDYKILICQDVSLSGAKSSNQLSKVLAEIIKLPEADCDLFDNEIISLAIINAENTSDSIRILSKCIPSLDEKWTMNVLAQLPTPFNEIALYGKLPKIPNTNQNLEFAKLLVSQKFVSSIKEMKDVIKVNTFKSPDHSERNNL
jgi:hypothetical protein